MLHVGWLWVALTRCTRSIDSSTFSLKKIKISPPKKSCSSTSIDEVVMINVMVSSHVCAQANASIWWLVFK